MAGVRAWKNWKGLTWCKTNASLIMGCSGLLAGIFFLPPKWQLNSQSKELTDTWHESNSGYHCLRFNIYHQKKVNRDIIVDLIEFTSTNCHPPYYCPCKGSFSRDLVESHQNRSKWLLFCPQRHLSRGLLAKCVNRCCIPLAAINIRRVFLPTENCSVAGLP